MNRLTTDKEVQEMGMVELARNSCYIKGREAWYRDYDLDMDARGLAMKLLADLAGDDGAFTCDEDFDDRMADCMQDGMDGIEGLIAVFYRNLWAMADLRERLMEYEDLEEQGLLLKLPCKVGDTVYRISTYGVFVDSCCITGFAACDSEKSVCYTVCTDSDEKDIIALSDFNETVFLTRQEAENASKDSRWKIYGITR